MSKQKEQVLEYFQTDRSLRGARDLYNQLPQKSLALQNNFARMADLEKNVRVVHYELAKAVGINERQLKILLQKPLKEKLSAVKIDSTTPPKDTGKPWEEMSNDEKLNDFNAEKHGYFKAKEVVKTFNLKPAGKKKEDLYAVIAQAKAAAGEKKNEFQAISGKIKASVKLFEQFPFLREKKTPDSLKILVNDLITDYYNLKENQPKLHEQLSKPDAKELVEVVLEDYIDNKKAWAELEHYKANGEILGEHPLFARLALKNDIASLNAADLAQKIKNLEINIGKNKTKGNAELVERDEDLLAHAKGILEKR